MFRALATVATLVATSALAQPDGGTAAPSNDADSLRRDFEEKLGAARREVKELREEMRAQLATKSVSQGWQEDWVEEKRKLELVTFDGYFRVRPELFYKFDMGRPADPAGYTLWPKSPLSGAERTNAGVNMRFRFEPTINISEEVRIRAQIDALDNVVWGSTPDYAFSQNGSNYWYDRYDMSLFSESQVPPRSGVNSLQDSIALKRVWGEVSTPVGIFRFGRMGSQWGLGMMHNDGSGMDADHGDTVDRAMFVTEPLPGFYVTPMLDINVEGLLSPRQSGGGQPFDLSNSDESHSFILAVARRDTDKEAAAKMSAGQTVFNYGLHFTYRVQRNEDLMFLQPYTGDGSAGTTQSAVWVSRQALLFMPDLWGKIEKKNFRLEAEVGAVLGTMKPFTDATPDRNLWLWQFGGVVQGEYKFLNGDLEVGGEVGFATGDEAPGFGNFTRRQGSGPNGSAGPGDIDGRQWNCVSATACTDRVIRNFRFNTDYRVDMILFREILGGVTDAVYVKPKISYRITHGFNVFAAAIYSHAMFASSTPSAMVPTKADGNLGIELNVGARYETEDGFFGQLQYGYLFPLAGFSYFGPDGTAITLDNPQALRAVVGIRY